MQQRTAANRLLVAALDTAFAAFSCADLLARFAAAGIPFSPVNSYPDIASDPQVLANGYVVELEHPQLGPIHEIGMPIRLSRTAGQVRAHARLELGQDTEEVLLEIRAHLGRDQRSPVTRTCFENDAWRLALPTASELLARTMKARSVTTIFHITGAPNIQLTRECEAQGIGLVGVRHEIAAAGMAFAYARVTRRPAVCLAPAGPGAVNMIPTAVHAQAEETPIIMLGVHRRSPRGGPARSRNSIRWSCSRLQ